MNRRVVIAVCVIAVVGLVLVGVGSASASPSDASCKPGWGQGDTNHCHNGPPGSDRGTTSTSTTTTTPSGRTILVFPEGGGPGTPIDVTGTGCIGGTTPRAQVTFAAAADPGTVLTTGYAIPDANGNWMAILQTPDVTVGAEYLVAASCVDFVTFPPTVLFDYGPGVPFIGAPPDCPPAC
jgi:hypothetical protein